MSAICGLVRICGLVGICGRVCNEWEAEREEEGGGKNAGKCVRFAGERVFCGMGVQFAR